MRLTMADSELRLPVHCLTVDAEELRVQLVIAADQGDGIHVDASNTQTIGQAVLQLLIAARAEAVATGQDFALEHLDPALAARLTGFGLADVLGLEKDFDL
jgi:anti-anti-sigma regulatory factor